MARPRVWTSGHWLGKVHTGSGVVAKALTERRVPGMLCILVMFVIKLLRVFRLQVGDARGLDFDGTASVVCDQAVGLLNRSFAIGVWIS